VIAAADPGGPVRDGQEGLDFVGGEERDDRLLEALARNRCSRSLKMSMKATLKMNT